MSKKFEEDNAPSVRLAKEEKRYRYSGKRMAVLLNVTPEEEAKLSVVVGATVKAVRDRSRKTTTERARQRRAGVVERVEYEAGSLSKMKPLDRSMFLLVQSGTVLQAGKAGTKWLPRLFMA